MVVNMNMHTDNEGGINDYLCSTICSVFDSAYTVSTRSGNVELFASSGFDCREILEQNLFGIQDNTLYAFIRNVSDSLEKVENEGYIFTDDKAPVELLGMSVLDEMISDELANIKQLIKGKSIKDLYNMLISA